MRTNQGADFTAAAEALYRAAGHPWPGKVFWVDSPMTGTLAAPIAVLVIQRGFNGVMDAFWGADLEETTCRHTRLWEMLSDGPAPGFGMSMAADAVNATLQGENGHSVYGAARSQMAQTSEHGRVLDDVARGMAQELFAREERNPAPEQEDFLPFAHRLHEGVTQAVREATGCDMRDLPFTGDMPWAVAHALLASNRGMGHAASPMVRALLELEVAGDEPEMQTQMTQYRDAIAIMSATAGMWWLHRDFVMACPPPLFMRQERVPLADGFATRLWQNQHHPQRFMEQLHCIDGPALAWADGWSVHAVHGLRLPFCLRHLLEQPERICVADIEAEPNAEIRRVMMERYGLARYAQDSGAMLVHELPADHHLKGLRSARLWRKDVAGEEPLLYVDLLNSTPEPDGSVRRYWLRVDPSAYDGEASRNAHAAVASTWRNGASGRLTYRRWQNYAPAAES